MMHVGWKLTRSNSWLNDKRDAGKSLNIRAGRTAARRVGWSAARRLSKPAAKLTAGRAAWRTSPKRPAAKPMAASPVTNPAERSAARPIARQVGNPVTNLDKRPAANSEAMLNASTDDVSGASSDASPAVSTGLINQAARSAIMEAARLAESTDSITVLVRMGAGETKLKTHFYCVFFRSSVLFWPASYGKTVLVLDEESDQDHTFAATLLRQTKQHFPDRQLEVLYEPLPKDLSVLSFPGSPKSPGYNRALWSSFFIDLYTNDSVIAWMDSDAGFVSPVTKSSIFNGAKLRVLGYDCTVNLNWVQTWARTTEMALGLPFVADFMTYFPVYVYRDTFTHCREHILKRFKTNNFEEAFKKFYHGNGFLPPVIIVLSYAWYFERDRYDWNLKICTGLMEYNKRFPSGHTIGPEHIKNILTVPQTVFHPKKLEQVGLYIRNSYCLSHEAAGNEWAKCTNRSAALTSNLVLFNHDIQKFNFPTPPCPGHHESTCLQVLEQYYNHVGLEIKRNSRRMDWRDTETVEKLANEVELECTSIK